ncbi:MAG TPA: LysR family transcriptional regulator [Devosiaceae bacterium]
MPRQPEPYDSPHALQRTERPRGDALSPALLTRVFHQPALIYFVAAAENLSIREAARQLNVASSAVTRQVAQLEDALGLALFIRENRRLRLSPAGEILFRHARRLPAPLEAAVTELEMLRGNRTGSVRIASVESIGLSFLPRLIAAFGAQYPQLSLELAIGTAAEVVERLDDERADLGFGFITGDPGRIEMTVRREVRVGAVMPPTHPLASSARLTLADCLEHPAAIAMPEISIRQVIAPFLRRMDRPLPALVEANSIRLLVELALSGRYVSIMTPLGAQDEILSGELVFRPLADEGMPTNHFGILARSVSALQFAPAVFYRHARSYFEDLGLPASR